MRSDNLAKERLGLINKNNYGSLMEIAVYKNCEDIWVKFERGNSVHTDYKAFRKGEVRNVYDKSVYSVGYIGEGDYKVKENGKMTPQYRNWRNMLQRCYDERIREKNPTYEDCIVVEEWHNFQAFAKWYNDNYYEIDGEEMCLDKDILKKGSKIYCPETCIFVSKRINNLFTKGNAKRGDLPIGVIFHKRDKKYVAQCHNLDKRGHIGYFNTMEEAFDSYKIVKERYIKQIAEEYKDNIPLKLYNAMYTYEVEITD